MCCATCLPGITAPGIGPEEVQRFGRRIESPKVSRRAKVLCFQKTAGSEISERLRQHILQREAELDAVSHIGISDHVSQMMFRVWHRVAIKCASRVPLKSMPYVPLSLD